MRQSQIALSVRREFSSTADTANHKWLERAGFIVQHAAGIYHYGHLFTRSLRKLEALLDHYLEQTGATQVQLSQMQSSALWQKSGRWDVYNAEGNSGAMFTTKGRNGHLYALAATAEEAAVEFVQAGAFSTKALQAAGITIYQHGNKLRDEMRAAGGVIRGKEFRMMDAYSFSADVAGMKQAYASIRRALVDFLKALKLDFAIVSADNGDMGGEASEELMVFSEIGGDTVWTDQAGNAANEEVATQIQWGGEIQKRRAIEVGHIFQLGTKYSEKMGLLRESGQGRQAVQMGCYGVGTSRLLAAYVEQNHDDAGMIWDSAISAYDAHVLQLSNDDVVTQAVASIERSLQDARYDVLIDDRQDVSAGAKFVEADILGQTRQIIVGKKNAAQGLVEIKDRRTGTRTTVRVDEIVRAMSH